jgi:hypothetical protein
VTTSLTAAQLDELETVLDRLTRISAFAKRHDRLFVHQLDEHGNGPQVRVSVLRELLALGRRELVKAEPNATEVAELCQRHFADLPWEIWSQQRRRDELKQAGVL